jgi:hypothetical protein
MLYTAVGTQTAAAKTALGITSTAAIRPRIVGFTLSNIGTVSVDSAMQIQAKRFTAAGTSTAVTPAASDSGDPAATFVAGSNHTVEPTYTASTTLKDLAVNPRSTFRWVAYEQRAELLMPATAANGIGFLVNAIGGALTVNVDCEVLQ